MIFISLDNEFNRHHYPNEINTIYHLANIPAYIHVHTLTSAERQERMNYRNFFLTATMDELRRELFDDREHNTAFRRACIRELIREINETN